jgi:fatty-acyl-CoA synthase
VIAPLARTYFDLCREQAVRHGDAPALIHAGHSVTYRQLEERAAKVAAALRADGVRHGDRVGLLLPNRPEWVEIAFGAGGAGAVAVPFSTWSTRQELDFLLRDSGVTHLFALARFGDRDYAADLAALLPELPEGGRSERFPSLRTVVIVDPRGSVSFTSFEQFLFNHPPLDSLPPGEAAAAGDDALILYTSGSSALPKAVRLKHHGCIENGFNIGERQGYGPSDRVLLSPPLFWSYGSANALSAALTHGAALVLQDKFGATESIELIERHGCTAIYTLPGITAAIVRDPAFTHDRVKTLRTGLTIGSPQDVYEAATKLGAAEICNVYGATETYGNCCVSWHHWPLEKRMNCQGPPLPGNSIRFIDEGTGAEVPLGQPGLAEVRGYVTPAYSGASAEQNDKAFTHDGFYRTGDIGQFDEEGNFVFVGRNTEMIKRAGINVSPAEVENILLLHPKVESAGVVGVAEKERGELVIAFVVPRHGDELTEAELLQHCRSIASKYKVPDRIEIRPALPLTPTGKLQRRELKQDASDLVALMGGARG